MKILKKESLINFIKTNSRDALKFLNMKGIELQIKEIKTSLDSLSKTVNENKNYERVHRGNAFNKNFSIILSSLEDISVFAERLDLNINQSIEVERIIQHRIKKEDKDVITAEGQRLRKVGGKLNRFNQTDFKALYIFSKIFLDRYTKLFCFLLPWRGISSSSITKFFHSLENYNNNDPLAIDFIKKYLKRLKAVDVFLTSYRDKFIVHAEFDNLNGTWFMNHMNGKIQFVHPSRPSVAPEEIIFVVKNYIVLSSKFIVDNWAEISKQ